MAASPSSSTPNQAILEYGPDSGGRMKNVSVVKPIVIGNVATYFGKKRESDGHTHNWTIYLKPYPNEDYSGFIKKVQFKLHDSYDNPNRVITEPPYEVSETGWGEFEIPIKIYFMDPTERPVTVYHHLKLFHNNDGPEVEGVQFTPKKKSVTAESYDEMVFHEPSRYLKSLLDNLVPITKGKYEHATDFESQMQDGMDKLNDAKRTVRAEIEELKNKLKLSQETLTTFRLKLSESQEAGSPDKMKKDKKKNKKKPGGKKLAKSLSAMKLDGDQECKKKCHFSLF